MIKLICIDVDGTLMGKNGVHPRVWEAAERARQAGTHLAICTGRPALSETYELAQKLDPNGWHIFQGGACLHHTGTEAIEPFTLSLSQAQEIHALQKKHDWVLELYSPHDYVVETQKTPAGTHLAKAHAELLGLPYTPRPFDSLKGALVRAQWVVDDSDFDTVMKHQPKGLIYSGATSPAVPNTHFISVTQEGVDKASAIANLAQKLGTTPENTMMIGDGLNDLSALSSVGYPIAMANAHPQVLALASRQVAHVDDGGVAEAIDFSLTL